MVVQLYTRLYDYISREEGMPFWRIGQRERKKKTLKKHSLSNDEKLLRTREEKPCGGINNRVSGELGKQKTNPPKTRQPRLIIHRSRARARVCRMRNKPE